MSSFRSLPLAQASALTNGTVLWPFWPWLCSRLQHFLCSACHQSYHLQHLSEEMMLRHSPPQPVGWSMLSLQSQSPQAPLGTQDWTDKHSRDTEGMLSLAAPPPSLGFA